MTTSRGSVSLQPCTPSHVPCGLDTGSPTCRSPLIGRSAPSWCPFSNSRTFLLLDMPSKKESPLPSTALALVIPSVRPTDTARLVLRETPARSPLPLQPPSSLSPPRPSLLIGWSSSAWRPLSNDRPALSRQPPLLPPSALLPADWMCEPCFAADPGAPTTRFRV